MACKELELGFIFSSQPPIMHVCMCLCRLDVQQGTDFIVIYIRAVWWDECKINYIIIVLPIA